MMSAASAEALGQEPVLSVRNVSKEFGATRALDGVSFDLAAGEVHGLVGENGSGKSTLIKTLSGLHLPEPGSVIEVAGEQVPLPISAASLQRLGLRFVHQDLMLAPTLTVAENLFVNELSTEPSWLLRDSQLRRRAEAMLAPYGRELDPAAKVGTLAAADQAHLAIVRAVSGLRRHHALARAAPGVLVLDEVTAFLPSAGRAQLFELIHEIAAQGDSVVFVSHYLDEVLEITSRITVLRDGKLVSTVDTADVAGDDLVEMIIGRRIGTDLTDTHTDDVDGRPPVVTVSDLSGPVVRGLGFSIREGEVLGVAGLIGSGFEEIPALLFGAQQATTGRLQLGEQEFEMTSMTPSAATGRGIAFVPEDRAGAGAAGALTVEENLSLQVISRYQRRGLLHRSRLHHDAAALLDDYDIRPRDPGTKMANLSGGNQQKVIMAKWLATNPSLLLLHEPTHGVDVGSREQILLRIRKAAHDGMAVLCASSDTEQLSELCDRVLVLARGRVVAELPGHSLTKEAIAGAGYLTTPIKQMTEGS
ncbi:sugar ABC transporter ATP-binding protein [Leekyejoonella antrihumi]|uniref:Sugar ABC transporter ATP-binding protein n=1 Tax=Leekyejoonella antrihumi TaxID=1660198 RepID=A0A563DUX8_9MICO|nr:sugar ABC transporter ATP-binding protein [Leekyejoonella antrihumi]TWP34058.1 sugar ABC transporter ATP-binding protein [Leekyejoonella antrihumi]